MAMYKSLFDLSPEQTASTAMPRTVVFSNGTGSGSMTICPLFLGAELYYNDMHLAFFEEATAPMRNVIEINHCRVGRYECSFGANSCCYLAAGDFAVCAAARKKSSSCFPLRHYHGITILLDLDAISPEMRKQMEWYGVDLDVIRRTSARKTAAVSCGQNRPLPIFFQSFTQRILCRTPAIFG